MATLVSALPSGVIFHDEKGAEVDPRKAAAVSFCRLLSGEEWDRACAFIRQSGTLKKVKIRALGGGRAAYDCLSAMFDANQHYNCPLESIVFPGNHGLVLRRRHIGIVLEFMGSRHATFWSLDLKDITLGDGCVGLIIEAMNTGVRIKSLKMGSSGQPFGDDDIRNLLSSRNSQYLSKLQIHNSVITRHGFDTIAEFLRRESTSIEKLMVFGSGGSSMDVDCAQMLLSSIPANSTLQRIQLGKLCRDHDSCQVATKKLKDLICNQSDFDSLCQSNHQLYNVGYSTEILKNSDLEILKALEINGRKYCPINQKCRSKLRSLYLVRDEFDVQPFIGMDVVLMPNVLELVTMSEECITEEKKGRLEKGTYVSARNGHLGSIYRLIRNCHLPELFSFPSPESKMDQLEAKIARLEAQLLSKSFIVQNKRLKPSVD